MPRRRPTMALRGRRVGVVPPAAMTMLLAALRTVVRRLKLPQQDVAEVTTADEVEQMLDLFRADPGGRVAGPLGNALPDGDQRVAKRADEDSHGVAAQVLGVAGDDARERPGDALHGRCVEDVQGSVGDVSVVHGVKGDDAVHVPRRRVRPRGGRRRTDGRGGSGSNGRSGSGSNGCNHGGSGGSRRRDGAAPGVTRGARSSHGTRPTPRGTPEGARRQDVGRVRHVERRQVLGDLRLLHPVGHLDLNGDPSVAVATVDGTLV